MLFLLTSCESAASGYRNFAGLWIDGSTVCCNAADATGRAALFVALLVDQNTARQSYGLFLQPTAPKRERL